MVAYEMLTTSGAARRAKCSEATIRSWLRSGQLDHQQTPLGALLTAAWIRELSSVLGTSSARTQTTLTPADLSSHLCAAVSN